MTCDLQCDDFVLSREEASLLLHTAYKEKNVPEAPVSVRCVSAEEIKQLNEKYRGKKSPTNVLTFSYDDANGHDIALCLEVAKKEANERAIPIKDYVALLLVHAFLHTIGMDHERSSHEAEETKELERNILSSCGFVPVTLSSL